MIGSISSQLPSEDNLSAELLLLTKDVTCRAALGKRDYRHRERAMLEMFSETQAMLTGFFYADYVPMLGWLDWFTGMRARLEKNFRELDGFYSQVIDEHIDRRQRNERVEDAVDAMLDMLTDSPRLNWDHVKGVLMVPVRFPL